MPEAKGRKKKSRIDTSRWTFDEFDKIGEMMQDAVRGAIADFIEEDFSKAKVLASFALGRTGTIDVAIMIDADDLPVWEFSLEEITEWLIEGHEMGPGGHCDDEDREQITRIRDELLLNAEKITKFLERK